MRIGVVTSSYAISPTDTVTAGVFVRDLAEELANLRHEVHVLSPAKHGQKSPPANVNECYIPWLGWEKDLASASMRNPLTLFRYCTLVVSGSWMVAQYAHAHALDALVAMWAIPSGLFCWRAWEKYGIPYGVWALGSDIWAREKYPLGDRIVRKVLREARFRFADGVQLAREAAQLANAPCEFVPSVRRLTTIDSEKVVLPPDLPHFLFIGRYEYNKGPDLLVESMRMLLDGGNTAHLHMFGVGRLEPHLRRRTRGYEDYIHLNGYADPRTVVAYMQACDRLIIPSRVESIPLVFVDALQMRLPVIAADIGDLGELVRQFGVGTIVPSGDQHALSVEMHLVRPRSRGELIGAWEKAQETFNLQRSATRCADALVLARPVS